MNNPYTMVLTKLPDIPNLVLHEQYTPADDKTFVGGDWYDAIKLEGDRYLAISIGDVGGHGSIAHTLMEECRLAFRTAISTMGHDMKGVAQQVNQTLLVHKVDIIVTAIFGIMDAYTGRFIYVNAGHLPPILAKPSGEVIILPYNGLALNIFEELYLEVFTIKIPPKGALIFYTDGIIEYDHNFLQGLKRLRKAIKKQVKKKTSNMAAAIQSAVVSSKTQRDDIAIFTMQYVPT